ncbi:MAG: hypothetical protein EAX96_12315 [Candidatus Lokiarchaeota archaeon]|nr:hypothetical protein [Candidatus Lokiarchaeota archaeon]
MAEKKVKVRLALEIHLIVFLSINLILFIINIIFTPEVLWVIIVLLSWGLGLTIHALTYFVKKGRNLAIWIHGSSAILVETMLLYINLIFQPTYHWFYFPLIIFLSALTIHCIFYYRSLKEKEDKEERNWYIKRIEKEAEKIKRKKMEED